MPRRHLRTYRRPKPSNEAATDLEHALDPREGLANNDAPRRAPSIIDYRPIIAVVGIVIFSLALIAFVFSLRIK